MLFNSLAFLIFLPVVLGLYYLVPRRWQNPLLLGASYVFYGWWDWRFLGLLWASTLVDFAVGIGIDRLREERARRRLLAVSVVLNLGFLGFFKYFDFFAASLAAAARRVGLHVTPVELGLVLPVGISFYTFHSISYTVDVYRRKVPATRDLVGYATFVAFFPQLVAGPIARARSLLPQCLGVRRLDLAAMDDGARLMLWGFFKKMVVADNMVGIVAAGYAPGATGGAVILGTYAFALQIYGDFSGYSDIGRGCARLFGFELMENFRAPYLATSLSDFWKRWHISLSTWFQEYMYIPLGGSRCSRPRHLFNVLLTFVASGFWHGADLRFLVWGAIHGIGYLPSVILRDRDGDRAAGRSALAPLRWLITFHFVLLAWVFFRAPSLGAAIDALRAVAHTLTAGIDPVSNQALFTVVVLGAVLLLAEFAARARPHPLAVERLPFVARRAFTLGLFAIILLVGNFDHVPFVYFQF